MIPVAPAHDTSKCADISERDVLGALRYDPGQWMSTDEILKVLGHSAATMGNHQAAIWALTRAYDREKIEISHEKRRTLYRVPPPPDPEYWLLPPR